MLGHGSLCRCRHRLWPEEFIESCVFAEIAVSKHVCEVELYAAASHDEVGVAFAIEVFCECDEWPEVCLVL